MSVSSDGQSSHGSAGRWSVVLDAGTDAWAIFEESTGAIPIAYGTEPADLIDLREAITSSIEGSQ